MNASTALYTSSTLSPFITFLEDVVVQRIEGKPILYDIPKLRLMVVTSTNLIILYIYIPTMINLFDEMMLYNQGTCGKKRNNLHLEDSFIERYTLVFILT